MEGQSRNSEKSTCSLQPPVFCAHKRGDVFGRRETMTKPRCVKLAFSRKIVSGVNFGFDVVEKLSSGVGYSCLTLDIRIEY